MTPPLTERIAAIRPFSRLAPVEQHLIAETAADVRYGAGERLFAAGERAEFCWVIHSGLVELTTTVPGRGDLVVQTVGRGDLLGWSWLVPPYRWHFDATALEPTSALRLDAGRLRAIAEQDPAFGYALTRTLFEVLLHRLQGTRARLLDLYRNPGLEAS